jgi:hypothetical protein
MSQADECAYQAMTSRASERQSEPWPVAKCSDFKVWGHSCSAW